MKRQFRVKQSTTAYRSDNQKNEDNRTVSGFGFRQISAAGFALLANLQDPFE